MFKSEASQAHTVSLNDVCVTYREIHRPVQGNGKTPLLIGLHGHGMDENQIETLVSLNIDQPYTYIAPRGFVPLSEGGHSWFDFELSAEGFSPNARSVRISLDRLAAFIPAAVAATNTDPRQVYLVGYSMGGGLSMAFALAYPNMIAGAVSMAGQLTAEMIHLPYIAYGVIGKPLFIGHGLFDNLIPARAMHQTRDNLLGMGLDVTYHEYRIPHVVSAAERADVSQWLSDQIQRKRTHTFTI